MRPMKCRIWSEDTEAGEWVPSVIDLDTILCAEKATGGSLVVVLLTIDVSPEELGRALDLPTERLAVLRGPGI
jgi:hypothetical protein